MGKRRQPSGQWKFVNAGRTVKIVEEQRTGSLTTSVELPLDVVDNELGGFLADTIDSQPTAWRADDVVAACRRVTFMKTGFMKVLPDDWRQQLGSVATSIIDDLKRGRLRSVDLRPPKFEKVVVDHAVTAIDAYIEGFETRHTPALTLQQLNDRLAGLRGLHAQLLAMSTAGRTNPGYAVVRYQPEFTPVGVADAPDRLRRSPKGEQAKTRKGKKLAPHWCGLRDQELLGELHVDRTKILATVAWLVTEIDGGRANYGVLAWRGPGQPEPTAIVITEQQISLLLLATEHARGSGADRIATIPSDELRSTLTRRDGEAPSKGAVDKAIKRLHAALVAIHLGGATATTDGGLRVTWSAKALVVRSYKEIRQ